MYINKKINMLKLNFYLIGLLVLTVPTTFSCSQVVYPKAEGRFNSFENQTLNINAIGYGKNAKDALDNARKNAVDLILFKGIPGSPYANPMIEEGDAAISKHKNFFNTFYESKKYMSYITEEKVDISPQYYKGNLRKTALNLGINVKSLRADLEANGIVRKFGF